MTRIALIGLPGSGKSSVGRRLADEVHGPFVDLDDAIVEQTGLTVPALFAEYGESGFRERELQTLLSVTVQPQCRRAVLATGGGVIVTAACREVLSTRWYCVYLAASVRTLVERLCVERSGRPLLNNDEPLDSRLARLAADRVAYYESTAKATVHVDGLSPEAVLDAVLAVLPTHCEGDLR